MDQGKLENLKALGFTLEAARVERGECPFCGQVVDQAALAASDDSTRREFEISGLCPKCQGRMFE